ncbi:MAG TPA: Hsp20/alpha crystallin family protein [Pseudonocardiaceae bacterium]
MAVAVRGSTWDPFATAFRVTRAFAPAADVTKDGNDVVVTLALPGVDVDKDVEVTVTAGRLAITGHRGEQAETDKNGFLRREIHTGEFRREFAIPRDVTADRVEAAYDKGLLQVRLREVVRQAPEVTKIQVRSIAPAAAPAVESGTTTE